MPSSKRIMTKIIIHTRNNNKSYKEENVRLYDPILERTLLQYVKQTETEFYG